MSAQSESARFARLQWVLRKLVGLFVVYVAVGSIYKSILADSVVAIVLYALLGVAGFYLLANW